MKHSTKQENSYFHSFLLLVTATIWGVAFVAQTVGMDHVGPLTFVAARSIVAVIASILSIITFFFILLPPADMLDISAFILEYGYFITIRRKES